MDQKDIMFFENNYKSYTIIDLYLNSTFLGYKDSYIVILMLIKHYYLKKVIMNILLDITM